MKNRFLLTLFFLFSFIFIWAQGVPQGINYQAVARDSKGIPIANQEINFKISLLAGDAGGKTVYEETHNVQSGALGMFSLVVGKGKTLRGDFTQVPWSESEIWIEIAIDENKNGKYIPLSASQLMAVPYALHAGTADEVTDKTGSGRADLGPSPYWKVNGNNMTIPGSMFLGTIDCKDLVFKTNSISRMSISCTGIVDIGGNLFVGGTFNAAGIVNFTNTTQSTNINNGAVIIDGGLGVEKNVNIGGTVCVDGVTTLKNTTESTTKDNGSLVVEGGVGIEKNINVGGNSKTNGNSDVIGNSDVGGTLGVTGIGTFRNKAQSTTINNGSLIVDGGAGIEMNLNVGGNTEVDGTLGVDGVTTLRNNLMVTDNDPNFVATITNTNNASGDGLLIKLGKARTTLAPPALPTISNDQIQRLRNLISCDYTGDKIILLGEIVTEGLVDDLKTVAGLAVGTGNLIIDFLNTELSLPRDIGNDINTGIGLPFNLTEPINTGLMLPYKIGPYGTQPKFISDEITLFGGYDDPLDVIDIPRIYIPGLTIPEISVLPEVTVMPELPEVIVPGIPLNTLVLPAFPNIDLSDLGVTAIDPTDLDFWGIPSFCLSDVTSTPLNNDNEFIRFTDMNDVKVGSIRGESVANWTTNYLLNPVYLYTLYGAFTSSKIDKLHALYHFKVEISKAIKDYISIGVEYSSGNGDYAEWLERKDSKEFIAPGDIVGVSGGKITKDLTNAEQVMAVSHHPIVLGNVPDEYKIPLGNNIAFMGQIPVKVMGPVKSGDYIVGDANTPGYGVAKQESDMTIDDFKHAVGRSWVTDLNRGPKMVNTVVGVHNGDFIKILKKHESRFNSLEAKVDFLMNARVNDAGTK